VYVAEAVMDVCWYDSNTVAGVESVLGYRLWDVRQGLRPSLVVDFDYTRVRFSAGVCVLRTRVLT
jgi:hypothetical protein